MKKMIVKARLVELRKIKYFNIDNYTVNDITTVKLIKIGAKK